MFYQQSFVDFGQPSHTDRLGSAYRLSAKADLAIGNHHFYPHLLCLRHNRIHQRLMMHALLF